MRRPQPSSRASAEQENLRERERLRMGNRDQRLRDAHLSGAPGRAPLQLQVRRPTAPNDLDVFPHDAARLSGAERLHGRLFDREPAGQVRNRVPALCTIGNLAVGEDAAQETIAVSFEKVSHAMQIRRVDSDANDVHA